MRGHRPIVWGGESDNNKINNINASKLLAATGESFYTQQPTKNGQTQGRRGWRRGTNMGEWQRDANAPHLHVEGERG
jgi:hypothetical protein